MIRLTLLLVAASAGAAPADDPLGWQRLQTELGTALPDGRGIAVGQVEPPAPTFDDDPKSKTRSHVPQPGPAFDGVTFHNVRSGTPRGSRHATSAAKRFYGRQHSMSPGVTDVHIYTANAFLQRLASAAKWPRVRVWNHSWVGASGAADNGLLRALDRTIDQQDWVVAVGVTNKGANKPLLASAFNVLSVGRSDGGHGTGAVATDDVYGAQRERPHLVAPAATTSAATPNVASAAVLLLDALPAGLDKSVVVRAALMAGAARRFDRSVDPGARAQPDYRAADTVRTDNGLDTRFGAGQLNVYNSYRIVRGPRVRSIEADADAAPITRSGFDYDEAFYGLDKATRTVRYRLAPEHDQTLTVALIWMAEGGRRFVLRDLDLTLSDVTQAAQPLASSSGRTDVGEHLRAKLTAGREYELTIRARRSSSLPLPYALAWRLH